MREVLVLLLLGACGRIGFDLDDDAGPGPDADLAKVCGAAYQPVPGLRSRYRVASRNVSWFTAELDCESDGGHLAIPDDAIENGWINDQTTGWIGVSDHAREGSFVTVTGGPPTITMFDAMEPSDSNNDEDCIEVRANRLWNDTGCKVSREFVCECDGVKMPSTPVWCDTTTATNCGECGTPCPGSLACNAQICT